MACFRRYLFRARAVVTFLLVVGLTPNMGRADDKDVLTQHNDNLRTGHYTAETVINPSTIKNSFGLQFDLNLHDTSDQIYAQPLYVYGLSVPFVGTRNVLFVATENNWLYAFDADRGGTVWPPVQLGQPVLAEDIGNANSNSNNNYVLYPAVGITSTPVIDRSRNRIFVVSTSKTSSPGCSGISHTIYAVNISTGVVTNQRTITIPGSVTIKGTGGGSSNGVLPFAPCHHINRAGLLLQGDTVYVAFAGAFEEYEYHGWVFGFNADTLTPTGRPYVVNPNGDGGGIWQSGNGLAGDGIAIYAATGNGGNGQATDNTQRFMGPADPRGSSVVKLSSDLQELHWFTPHNQQCLDSCNLDLSSAGPVLLPGLQLLIAGGKEGRIYLLDTGNLGHGPLLDDTMIKQCFRATVMQDYVIAAQKLNLKNQVLCENNLQQATSQNHYANGPCTPGDKADKTQVFGQIHGSPVIWTQDSGSHYRIYVHGKWDILKSFEYSNGLFVDKAGQPLSCKTPDRIATPVDQSSDPSPLYTGPGGALSLSSNNQRPGSVILWESVPMDNTNANDAEVGQTKHTGLLRAYDASNLQNRLWEQRLDVNGYAKFVPPTVANGRVYMAESGKVRVFGPLGPLLRSASVIRNASADVGGTWSGTFQSRNSAMAPITFATVISRDSQGQLIGKTHLGSRCIKDVLKEIDLKVTVDGSNVSLAGSNQDGVTVTLQGTIDQSGTLLNLRYIINASASGLCEVVKGTGNITKQ